MAERTKYKRTEITAFLESQGADSAAARAAAKDIARAWNDRYFFRSYTHQPLDKCVVASSALTCSADALLDRLVRRFQVFVHDVWQWGRC